MTDETISLLFGDARTTPNSRYNWAATIFPAALEEYAGWQLGRAIEATKTVVYFRTKSEAQAFETGVKRIVAGLRGNDAPVAEVFAAEHRDHSWRA